MLLGEVLGDGVDDLDFEVYVVEFGDFVDVGWVGDVDFGELVVDDVNVGEDDVYFVYCWVDFGVDFVFVVG